MPLWNIDFQRQRFLSCKKDNWIKSIINKMFKIYFNDIKNSKLSTYWFIIKGENMKTIIKKCLDHNKKKDGYHY